MKFCLIVFLFLLTIGNLCAQALYVSLAYIHMNEFAAQIKKEEQIHTFGLGSSLFASVRLLSFSLECNKIVTIPEARKLAVKLTEQLCDQVNKDKKIRPYLHDYPFNSKNLFFSFWFKSTEQAPSNTVSYLAVCNEKICYECLDGSVVNEMYKDSKKAVNNEIFQASSN